MPEIVVEYGGKPIDVVIGESDALIAKHVAVAAEQADLATAERIAAQTARAQAQAAAATAAGAAVAGVEAALNSKLDEADAAVDAAEAAATEAAETVEILSPYLAISPAALALMLDPLITLPVKSSSLTSDSGETQVDIGTGLTAPLSVTRYSGSTDVEFEANGTSIRARVAGGLALGTSIFSVAQALQTDGRGMLVAVDVVGVPAELPSGLVQRLMSWDVPAQADNSDITTLTASDGHVYTVQSTSKPKYRTGGLGGKPYFQVANGQYATAPRTGAAGAALEAVFATRNYTIIAFVADTNTGTQTNASYWGTFDGTNILGLRVGNTGIAGSYRPLSNGTGNYPANNTGLLMVAHTATVNYPWQASGVATLQRVYVNGSCIGSTGSAALITASDFGLFGLNSGANSWNFGGKGYGHLVFNRALSPAEIKQVYKWFADQTGQTVPWASVPAIRILWGNSIDNGQNSTAPQYSPMGIVAATNGYALGTWDNLGASGINTKGLLRNITDVIDIGRVTGKPIHVGVQEYYNEVNSTGGSSPAGALADIASMVGQIKSARPSAKIFVTTPTTSGSDLNNGFVKYDTFVNGMIANYSSWGADGIARVDQDANIGRAGDPNNTTYFGSDKLHLTGTSGVSGYRTRAGILAPAFSALAA